MLGRLPAGVKFSTARPNSAGMWMILPLVDCAKCNCQGRDCGDGPSRGERSYAGRQSGGTGRDRRRYGPSVVGCCHARRPCSRIIQPVGGTPAMLRRLELTGPIQDGGPVLENRSQVTAGALPRGPSIGELLRLSTLSSAEVLAGRSGLHRVVQRLNVMTVPDILPWVKEHEFLLATGYPLPRSPVELAELVTALDARGLAALGVKLGKYIEALPHEMLRCADQLDFPIIDIPQQVGFDDILSQALTDIVNRQSAVLARAEEIHRVFMQIVLHGGGLPEITEKLSQLIEGAVVVLDNEDRVLAASRLEEVSASLATAGLLADDGRIVAGVALVPQTHVQVTRGVRWAVAPVERKFRSDFLHELLSGRARNEREVLSRSRSLGWDLERPLIVVVAE